MQVMKKLAMLALGFTLTGGAVAYAYTEHLSGDFHEGQGAEDRYIVRCSDPTEICLWAKDNGPFDDNVFYVKLKCKSPKQSGTQRSTAPAGGSTDTVCVSNCDKAQFEIGCAIDSPYCDDDYYGQVSCYYEYIDVEQKQDQ